MPSQRPAPLALALRLSRLHAPAGAASVALLVLASFLGLPLVAAAQPPHVDTAAKTTPGTAAVAAGGAAATTAAQPKIVASSKPLWEELSSRQQQALLPLAVHWNTLTAAHKRKWLALSRNYATMAPDEQATLRSRMTEWAALSNQQRAQARLNFAEVKRVPADERKLKWEQYQALSAEEKRKLAERGALAKPRGAAIAVRPVSARKLVAVPATTTSQGQHQPRILLAPPAQITQEAPSTESAGVLMPVNQTQQQQQPLPAEMQAPAPSLPAPVSSAPTTPAPAEIPSALP
jgi:hypothetical protein